MLVKREEVICNWCGKSCTKSNVLHNYVALKPHFGYGSSFEGLQIEESHLCEECYKKLEAQFKIQPKKKENHIFSWG